MTGETEETGKIRETWETEEAREAYLHIQCIQYIFVMLS